MDPKTIVDIQKEIERISQSLKEISQTVNGLNINQQGFLKNNNLIPPGIAAKIAYDSKGLVVKGMGLEIADLPDIPIDKVTGLRRMLTRMEDPVLNPKTGIIPTITHFSKIDPGTALKVNWNDQGEITGFAPVLSTDIPDLPIDKIVGLADKLRLLEKKENDSDITTREAFNGKAGTGCKVSWDNMGRVLRGDRLSMNDMPRELTEEITSLTTKVALSASQETVTSWIIETRKKVDALTAEVVPGTYSKLTITADGLVLSGERLTIQDLPEITIRDISGLESTLRNTVLRSEFTNLQNNIESLLTYDPKVDIQRLSNQIKGKVEETSLATTNAEVAAIKRHIEQLEERIPGEMVQAQLKQLMEAISTLQGQVSGIEQGLMSNSSLKVSNKEGEE